MHEKRLARSAVPDGEAKFCIYPNGSLETLVTFEKGNRFLDGILFWHVGYRRTFLWGKLLHSLSLMPSGTAFARDIVHRPCTSLGVEIMSFLKEEHGGLLKKRWNLVLEKRFEETLSLVRYWTRALVCASEISRPLGRILAVTSPNTFMGAARRESQRDSTARP
jgi:hypothetical protein